jgi:hypothetical protein
MQIKKVVRLPEADSGLQHNIVRVNNRLIDSNKQDSSRFFRREPAVIIKGIRNPVCNATKIKKCHPS